MRFWSTLVCDAISRLDQSLFWFLGNVHSIFKPSTQQKVFNQPQAEVYQLLKYSGSKKFTKSLEF